MIFTSVLLDAGAGKLWSYSDSQTGKTYNRSEGLAIASFNGFMEGAFSSNPSLPLQADKTGLESFSVARAKTVFQISDQNPMEGFDGRVGLINALANCLEKNGRPGGLLGRLQKQAKGAPLAATEILKEIQTTFGAIWPGRNSINQFNLGDTWAHPALGEGIRSLVPFHKLSQWLTYSLIETLELGGLQIRGIEELTGLPEYRNGGLFLDTSVIELRDPTHGERPQSPDSELIVEWRALTICLLDLIAIEIRKNFNKTEDDLSLPKILQGGTWAAGRKIANRKRDGGTPPIAIKSDGTVF